jgi:hypothetical protein
MTRMEIWKSINWLRIFILFFSVWPLLFIILINAAGTRIYQSTSPHKYNSTLLGNFQVLTVSSSETDLLQVETNLDSRFTHFIDMRTLFSPIATSL